MTAINYARLGAEAGRVVKEENIEILKDKGYVIHLVVDVDEASRRISDKSSRPLFSDLESARARLDERRPAYEAAAMRMCLRAEKASIR